MHGAVLLDFNAIFRAEVALHRAVDHHFTGDNIGGQLGAVQQRLEATASNLQTNTTNLTSARSVVQDANIPAVTSSLTQEEILQQAGVSALAQSHTLQQAFLKLLQ